ncbi:hypothetical protein [Streptomyces sp. NPDC048603]|uniref:hypothetical protein n=1 Tax=Streptomyces sp. NPDC048603 TaxID=3365577 RepID=UPI003712C78F
MIHATALGITTILLLLPAVALMSGWAPSRLRDRTRQARTLGWAALWLYLAAPLNAVPRLVGAPPAFVMACTAAGVLCALGAAACFLRASTMGSTR